ncbi:hypothetical protein DV736_g6636, partial [Chaetothyriales sp. CBS 134916]
MNRKLLLSGERADFTTLAFDLDKKELSILANYAAPFDASWIEPASSLGSIDRLVGLSEGLESGLLYSLEVNHVQNVCKITSQKPTLGAPCHFVTLHDGSALALGTYLGASVALYPISISEADGLLLIDGARTEVFPKFPYELIGHGPNEERQQQCHVHQILEDRRGLLYALDLGADRVWILHRDEMKLEICETIMYVIGELSHTVVAFDLSTVPAEAIQPVDGFAPNIIPHTVLPNHQSMMDSAEICLHPTIPNILYVSNRWERHIAEREPRLKNVPKELPPGDAVAIILLSSDGKKVESMKHVRCNVDVIRGMRLSKDGKYVVVVGQEGGGVEIYGINGEKGDVWTLVAGLNEGLEAGIKHAVWL